MQVLREKGRSNVQVLNMLGTVQSKLVIFAMILVDVYFFPAESFLTSSVQVLLLEILPSCTLA